MYSKFEISRRTSRTLSLAIWLAVLSLLTILIVDGSTGKLW